MIGKTNAQTIIQGGGGGDDMVLYHVTQTTNGNNCTLSLTTYNGEASDNYWVGTRTNGNKQELFFVEDNGQPVTTLKHLLDNTHSAASLFSGYTGTSVSDLISYADTENVTNMRGMFYQCTNLISIVPLNYSNVENMANMFYGCESLETVQLSGLNKVTTLESIFGDCYALTTVQLSNTDSLTNMANMFLGCRNLTTVQSFDTSKVTNMSFAFGGCYLKLKIIPDFNAGAVTDMNNMFSSCSKLEEIHMYGMKVSFDISASTQFTESALVEILNNLATVQTTRTLTMGSTNLAKLTAEEIAIATNKGWTLA